MTERRESRSCPVCGAAHLAAVRRSTDHLTGHDFTLATCGSCAAAFIADPPSPDDLPAYYDNESGQQMHRAPSRLFAAMRDRRIDADLQPLLRFIPPGATIVDLGAGDGSLVRRVLAAGRSAAAVDMYPPSAWRLQDVAYVQAAPGVGFTAEEIRGVAASPDAVVMRHVLEHVISPRATLAAARDAGAGFILVVVPNVESLFARLLPNAWYYWDPPRHLTFFAPSSLRLLAARAGFEVVFLGSYGIDEIVTSVHRAAALRARRSGSRWVTGLSRMAQPTGLLAGAATVAAMPFGHSVLHAVLRRTDGVRGVSAQQHGDELGR